MVDITNSSFLLYFFYFFLVVFVGYYIPGNLFLSRFKFPRIMSIPVSIVTGMVFLGYVGYAGGYLGVRSISYLYLFMCFLLWIIRVWRKKERAVEQKKAKPDYVFIGIVLIGIFCQLTAIWFTGVLRNGEAYYCCGDQNDDLWFAAVTNQLVERIPPFQPGMYGVLFQNYHYWSNLIISETSRLFGIPSFQLQFQYISVLLSVLLALLISGFSTILGLSSVFKRWLAIFFYFGGDLIYLILFALGKPVSFSMSSLEDGAGFLINFPRASGVIVCLSALLLFIYWIRKKDWYLMIILALLFGSLSGFKIYISIFAFVGLGTLSLYHALWKKDFKMMILFLLSGVCAAFIFLPVNKSAGGLFYSGLWRFENFAVQPALGLEHLEQARLIFANDSKWYRVVLFEIFFAVIYFVSTFGTKLIGLIQTKESMKKFPVELHILFISGGIVSLILGLFFLQNVGSSNTFNFLVTVFIFLSFYSALTCETFLKNIPRTFRYIVIILLVSSMLPRIVYRTGNNINDLIHAKGFKLTRDVVRAGNFLRNTTSRDILIAVDPLPFDFDINGPVFAAIAKRHMFFSGEGLLNGFQAQEKEKLERKNSTNQIFRNDNIIEVAKQLRLHEIDYLILSPLTPPASTMSASFLDRVFESHTVDIYKVRRDNIPSTVMEDASKSTEVSETNYLEMVRPYLR